LLSRSVPCPRKPREEHPAKCMHWGLHASKWCALYALGICSGGRTACLCRCALTPSCRIRGPMR